MSSSPGEIDISLNSKDVKFDNRSFFLSLEPQFNSRPIQFEATPEGRRSIVRAECPFIEATVKKPSRGLSALNHLPISPQQNYDFLCHRRLPFLIRRAFTKADVRFQNWKTTNQLYGFEFNIQYKNQTKHRNGRQNTSLRWLINCSRLFKGDALLHWPQNWAQQRQIWWLKQVELMTQGIKFPPPHWHAAVVKRRPLSI